MTMFHLTNWNLPFINIRQATELCTFCGVILIYIFVL